MSEINIDIKTSEDEVQSNPIEKEYLFRVYAKVKSLDILGESGPSSVETVYFFFIDEFTSIDSALLLTNVNDEKFELISRKIKNGSFTDYVDTVNEISKSMFDDLRERAKVGYKCLRYKYPLLDDPTRHWEVLSFLGVNGEHHPWVVCSCMNTDREPLLPFKVVDCIIENDPNNSEDTNDFIDELWTKQYFKIDERDIAEV